MIKSHSGVSYVSNKYSKGNNNYFKSYDPKEESTPNTCFDLNNLYGYANCTFFQTNELIWIDPDKFHLNKYTNNISKGCVLKLDLEYSKVLRKIRNDYPLAPNKVKIKRETLSNYQQKIADFYDIPVGNVRKLVSDFFNKEKNMLHRDNLQLYLILGLKPKNISHITIQSITMAKTLCRIQHKKNNRSRKKWGQRWKIVVQIKEKCCIWENNGKFEKHIQCKTCKQQK